MLRVTVYHGSTIWFQGQAAEAVLPAEDGELSVWSFHAPMLCALAAGMVTVDDRRLAVQGGVARMARNTLTVVSH